MQIKIFKVYSQEKIPLTWQLERSALCKVTKIVNGIDMKTKLCLITQLSFLSTYLNRIFPLEAYMPFYHNNDMSLSRHPLRVPAHVEIYIFIPENAFGKIWQSFQKLTHFVAHKLVCQIRKTSMWGESDTMICSKHQWPLASLKNMSGK